MTMDTVERSSAPPDPTRRRTMTRRSVLGAGTLAAAGGLTAALWPGDSPAPTPRLRDRIVVNDRSGSAVELVADVRPVPTNESDLAPISSSQQQFALDLLRHSPSTDNLVLSPSSLAIALAMLQLGAAGQTRAELAAVLHTSEISSARQAAGWAALTGLMAAQSATTVETANSVWQQRGLALRSSYLQALTRYFHAGVWQVDFAHHLPDALAAINAWSTKHTNGRITKLFGDGDLTADTVLALADAVYFKAAWKYRFDPKLTSDGPFRLANGATVQVPYMHFQGPLAMTGTSDYLAAQLPYEGGRFAAQLIAPTRATLPDLIASLTPHDLAKIAAVRAEGSSELLVPRFTVRSFTHLNPTLQAMGVQQAFTGSADFSAMSPTPLALQTVVQRDYLRVDERGTEAAAVTGGGMIATAARVPPAFDRPFLFLVRDIPTGIVLFAGQIQNPSV